MSLNTPDAGRFHFEIPVRFNDVDHARVVYFPKYLDYCHEAFEEFVAFATGRPYASVVNDFGLGYPAVHADVDYSAPSRFGDVLRIRVTCTRLGKKSATVRYLIRRKEDDEKIADASVTIACIEMDAFRAVPIPPEHRKMFEAHAE